MSKYLKINSQIMYSDEQAKKKEARLEPNDKTIFEIEIEAICKCVILKNIVLKVDQPRLGDANGQIIIEPKAGIKVKSLAPKETKKVRFTVTTKDVKPSGPYPQAIEATFECAPIQPIEDDLALKIVVSDD